MAIVIERIVDVGPSFVGAEIRHGEHRFLARVHGVPDELKTILGQSCIVEMAFDKVLRSRDLLNYVDSDSVIVADSSSVGAHVIRGRIHNRLMLEDGGELYDIYLKNGPEFVAVTSEELGRIPEGPGLELIVNGLGFHPTRI